MHAPDDPDAAHSTASPALVTSGALMLAAGLILANPYAGITDTRWPWDIILASPWRLVSVNWMLWFATALLAVVLGLLGPQRLRAPLLTALALTLVFTCHSQQAGLAIEQHGLSWFVGSAVLSAGFFLGSDGRHARSARALTALGGLVSLWALLASFEQAADGRFGARLLILVGDLKQRIVAGVVPDAVEGYDIELWAYGCAVLAATLGLLSLVGVRGTLVSRIGFLLMLLCFLIPTFSALGREASGTYGFTWSLVASRSTELLIHTGLALLLLCAAALADLARVPRDAGSDA